MSKHGPNVTKLIIQFIASEAVPPDGSLADAIEFFKNQEHQKRILAKAEAGALAAIQLIKTAPDNPYGNDDEVIAGALVEKIKERKAAQRQHRGY